jgi:peptide subunit release factor 1 (eRF1)
VPLAAPIPEHRLYVSNHPHLYPLARLISEYPRYAIVLADTQSARIEVWAGNAPEHTENIEGAKTKHHKAGGWSQARYQRHVENFHLNHAKEVIEALARIVRSESIESILMAADEVILPLLKEQLPGDLADRVVDAKLDVHAPERRVLETALEALREREIATDRERTDALIETYRANGLACVGVDDTRRALEFGEVDELLITETPETKDIVDELVAKAAQTSAKIRVIADRSLLRPIGGVGAFLRFKI